PGALGDTFHSSVGPVGHSAANIAGLGDGEGTKSDPLDPAAHYDSCALIATRHRLIIATAARSRRLTPCRLWRRPQICMLSSAKSGHSIPESSISITARTAPCR